MTIDLEIATATLFMESSDQPEEGKRAVAAVLVNRVKAGHFGKILAVVCRAAYQFSCWMTQDPSRLRMANTPDDDPVLVECKSIMQAAIDGTMADPTGSATFHSTSMKVPPSWAATMRFAGQLGSQRFYKSQCLTAISSLSATIIRNKTESVLSRIVQYKEFVLAESTDHPEVSQAFETRPVRMPEGPDGA